MAASVESEKEQANIYLFKANNRNTGKKCEICSKLTIETPERHLCQILFFVFALKAKRFALAGFLDHLLLLLHFSGIRCKECFTDHRTANTIQLLVAIKKTSLVYYFSEQSAAKGNSPEAT